MKNTAFVFVLLFLVFACKDAKEETKETSSETTTTETTTSSEKEYPDELATVFKAHGGFEKWNAMNNLCFEMEGKNGTEIHTVSLNDRAVKIENKAWTIGSTGEKVWLLENKEKAYTGDPRFYHNLMFYFFAMPFVVADDGINYSNINPTELDGMLYNGIKISYNPGVGDSPKDEYIIYYNPKTKMMEWLAYTVTYKENETSNDWHFIKYDAWQTVNGVQVPKKITWYNVKDGVPTDEKSDIQFDKVTLTETQLDPAVFKKPENAVFVEETTGKK